MSLVDNVTQFAYTETKTRCIAF